MVTCTETYPVIFVELSTTEFDLCTNKYMCKNSELSYKERLIHLKLLPINCWFEFLDLAFSLNVN